MSKVVINGAAIDVTPGECFVQDMLKPEYLDGVLARYCVQVQARNAPYWNEIIAYCFDLGVAETIADAINNRSGVSNE